MTQTDPGSSPHLLAGRHALVTGASQGIGAAIAEGLARAGCNLVLSAARPGPLHAYAEDLQSRFGVDVVAVPADLSVATEVHRLAGAALETIGGIDILVNNAGVSFPEPVVDLSDHAWDLTMAVNLRAPSLLGSKIGAAMALRGGGKIINVASAAALTALKDHYAYCVSKAGLVMATEMLALELGRFGVRANAICPTVVLTEMGQRVWGDAEKAAPLLDRIPAGRFAEPADVVAAVLYLAGPSGDMINGVTLPIDGGYTAA